jgi:glycerol-3-phosphate acyltransferase PlsY
LPAQKGVDLFKVGSGNIGATNVGRILGRKNTASLVFVLDFLKGALPGSACAVPL